MKALRVVLAVAGFGLSMMACERSASLEWTEDVLLPDGRVVTLNRFQEFKRPHEIGSAPGPSRHWFSFKHPATAEVIRWEDPGDLGTVALLFEGDTPHLLTKPVYGSSLRQHGCPNPPYLLFRYIDARWERRDLKELWVTRLRSNMTYGGEMPVERRGEGSPHLAVEVTQASTHDYQPWVMDFANYEQTFRPANCGHRLDYRLVPFKELQGEPK